MARRRSTAFAPLLAACALVGCGGPAAPPPTPPPPAAEGSGAGTAPAGATFSDDFESGDTQSWAQSESGGTAAGDGEGAAGAEDQRPPERK